MSRLHVSDYGLPAITDVDVLDADILVSAVAEAAKGLDLHRIGPQRSSRGGRAKRARYDRHSRIVTPAVFVPLDQNGISPRLTISAISAETISLRS